MHMRGSSYHRLNFSCFYHELIELQLSCSNGFEWQEVENWKMIVLYLYEFLLSTILCKSETAFFSRVFLPRLVHFHSSSTAFNEAFVVRCRNPHRLNCFPRIARPGPPPSREKTRVGAVANGPVDVPQSSLVQGWFWHRMTQP